MQLEQFLMRSVLFDDTFVYDEDDIRILDGGESMGDDDERTDLFDSLKRRLNDMLCLRVDIGSRLIKKHHARMID